MNELIFMRRTPGKFDYTLYSSRWLGTADRWTTPEIMEFSGEFRDGGPYLAPDGQTLVFDSRRPDKDVVAQSINLWVTNRTSGGWSEPELLREASRNEPSESAAAVDEFGPALDGVGNLYFYSFRQPFRGGHRYISEQRDWSSIELENAIPDPSAATFVCYTYIAPDGQWAILEGQSMNRRDTDLFYTTRRADGGWTEVIPMTLINTQYGEGGPYVSPDGKYLFLTSDRPTGNNASGNANLYMISTKALGIF